MKQTFVLALVSLTLLSVSVFADENEKISKSELFKDIREALSQKKFDGLNGVDENDKRHIRVSALKNILDRRSSRMAQEESGMDRETFLKTRIESKIAQLKERYNIPENFKLPANFNLPKNSHTA